jgi:hypothetical protein
VLTTLSTPSSAGPSRAPDDVSSPDRARYLALQQEADFALWRAREASLEVRKAFEAHLAGTGTPAPTLAQLAELTALERDAEVRYRELRAFLRERFSPD